MSHFIACDNAMNWAATYDGPRFHALLCDPPYELGFMGKDWDKSGIAFDVKFWKAITAHLLPGAFGMAFASTRGYHRMACAIEDAGMIIHPAINWVFGSGFPKATNIAAQIEGTFGKQGQGFSAAGDDGRMAELKQDLSFRSDYGYKPEYTNQLARAWSSHRYGLQALKPAFEFICVFQKPYDGKPVDCITATGAGALNVDKSRIGTSDKLGRGFIGWPGYGARPETSRHKGGKNYNSEKNDSLGGRWPANLILSHSPDCQQDGDAWRCVDGCAVMAMGEQSGIRPGSEDVSRYTSDSTPNGIMGKFSARSAAFHNDTGTAARFFFNADYTLERLENSDPFYYCAKASRGERQQGLNTENRHATVKPLKLTQHLATLLLPPAEYAPRRLLVPFAGVASEMIGAMLAGWDDVTGIEMDAEYCEIGRARVRHWAGVSVPVNDTIETKQPAINEPTQMSLFDMVKK